MRYFFSLSKSAASTGLDISEWILLIFGAILVLGIFGEYKKLPRRLLLWPPLVFEILVMIGVAGELLGDGGVFIFSRHLQTIEDRELSALGSNAEQLEARLKIVGEKATQAEATSGTASTKSNEAVIASGDALKLARGARQEADSFAKDIASAKSQASDAESHLAEANRNTRQLAVRMIPLLISRAQEKELSTRLSVIPGMVFNLIAPPGPHILPDPRSGERIWLAFGLSPAKDAGWEPRLLLSNDKTELGVVVRTRRGASTSVREIADRVVRAMVESGIEQAVRGPDFDNTEIPAGSEAGPTNKWAPNANMWIVVGS